LLKLFSEQDTTRPILIILFVLFFAPCVYTDSSWGEVSCFSFPLQQGLM
jgi:hypothetical protein